MPRKYATDKCELCGTTFSVLVLRPILARVNGEDNYSPSRAWHKIACRSCRNEVIARLDDLFKEER